MLIVVRHGRTEANASGLLLGRRLDPALDELGRRQAVGARRARCPPPGSSAARSVAPARRRRRSVVRSRSTTAGSSSTTASSTAPRCATCPRDVWAGWQADPSWAPAGRRVARRPRYAGAGCVRGARGRGGRARRHRRHPRLPGEGGAGVGARRGRRDLVPCLRRARRRSPPSRTSGARPVAPQLQRLRPPRRPLAVDGRPDCPDRARVGSAAPREGFSRGRGVRYVRSTSARPDPAALARYFTPARRKEPSMTTLRPTGLSRAAVFVSVVRRSGPHLVEASLIPTALFYACLVMAGLGVAYAAALGLAVRIRPRPPRPAPAHPAAPRARRDRHHRPHDGGRRQRQQLLLLRPAGRQLAGDDRRLPDLDRGRTPADREAGPGVLAPHAGAVGPAVRLAPPPRPDLPVGRASTWRSGPRR